MSLTRPYLDMVQPPDYSGIGDIVVHNGSKLDTIDLSNPSSSVFSDILLTDLSFDPITGTLVVISSDGITSRVNGFLTKEAVTTALKSSDINQGERGNRGLKGLDGKNGKHGVRGCQGSKGDTGPIGRRGDDGLPGIRGLQGYKGLQGDKGLPGAKGNPGKKGIAGQDGVDGIQGQEGPSGPVGVRGPRGDKGDRGDIGYQGPIGLNGPDGCPGEPGLQGEQGDRGCVGSPGRDAQLAKNGKDGLPAVIQDLIAGENIVVENVGGGIYKISCCANLPPCPTTITTPCPTFTTTTTTTTTTTPPPTTETTTTTTTTSSTTPPPSCAGGVPAPTGVRLIAPYPITTTGYDTQTVRQCWDISPLGTGPFSVDIDVRNSYPEHENIIVISYGSKTVDKIVRPVTSFKVRIDNVDPATEPCICVTSKCVRGDRLNHNWPVVNGPNMLAAAGHIVKV